MIPILYEKGETAFASNGLGRLRDCISCVVTEERNGIYECDFEYPIDGVNYDRIQLGRIIAVEHDETNDVQPFDIVSYSRPINGVVTFHAVHISYRQTALAVSGTNINSLADAFTLFGTASPSNPFSYWTDKDGQGYMASADGVPHSVRTMLGGMEGSVLDAYGGEYEWDRWTVKLWASRGELKNFTIRYGVNLVDYEEELDYSDTYNAVVPFWKGQGYNGNDIVITGDMVEVSYPTFNGDTRCIPLDVTDKFEAQPTKAEVEAQGLAYINANQTYLPAQTIKVDFVRITESGEYQQFANLQKCKLCDTIRVIFSRYNMEGTFKIVRTEYDVLQERYSVMELGTLSTTLAEALGINQDASNRLKNDDTGDFYAINKTTSALVANIDTYSSGASLTLGEGVYVIYCYGSMGTNGTGAQLRAIRLYRVTPDAASLWNWRNVYPNGKWATISATLPIKLTQETTLRVDASASVTANSASTWIIAVKIK